MEQTKKWGFWLLTAFVVGNMVGSGIFMLPSTLAQVASPLGVMTAWAVTGFGVLMLALTFGTLSIRKPELQAGPQSYARALFENKKTGDVASFTTVWGYWVANWISNVAIITSFAGYLSTFLPIMRDGRVLFHVGSQPIELGKLITFVVCSIFLWGTHTILVTSMNAAGKLNFVTTFSKVVGFALFIIAGLFAFQFSTMGSFYYPVESTDGGNPLGLSSQVYNAAISTLWAFVGIESAVILSGRASSQRDIKKATVAGVTIAIIIYMTITMITMGALPHSELQASDKPFVDVLNVLIGRGGSIIMALLALVSLFGSMLGWILLSSEVPYRAAREGNFPAFFAKTNKKGSPSNALLVTNIMSQIFIFSTVSGTISQAYSFLTTSSTLAYLIPYLISTIYFLKVVIKGETYAELGGTSSRIKDGIIAGLAFIYAAWVIISGTADMKTFSLGIGLFLIGIVFYPLVKRKGKRQSTQEM
ncbi:amino acid permease [Priestia filamentosa]|uniref:Arginine:ornithine antiporter n=1 Tax=Priestia filamentosa TaxID=1402861 RepID=A0A1X7F7B6_9BACI|nr:amino acid permease [Priestia filamentosa]AKO91796.1 arginine:ornithine antiporter [Priestia filamentosa]MDT3761937.1 amino acid permease [Priestia filamentosa]OXS68022.1 arginine:ornithine antiporter [Priestia filamentosa]RJS64778.1 amino acid permease [Priestia filamentosa]WCM17025.1 amino acid permease [Priestia filamentosa]